MKKDNNNKKLENNLWRKITVFAICISMTAVLIGCGSIQMQNKNDVQQDVTDAVSSELENEPADTELASGNKQDEQNTEDNEKDKKEELDTKTKADEKQENLQTENNEEEMKKGNGGYQIGDIVISDFHYSSGEYTDSVDNTYEYSYAVPQIEGPDTPAVKEANDVCKKVYDDYVVPDIENMEKGGSIYTFGVEYSVATLGDIISLMIEARCDFDVTDYYCIHIRKDGSDAETKDVLACFDLTPLQFLECGQAQVARELGYDENDDESYDEYKAQSVYGVGSQTPIYVDEQGKLHFITMIYTPAGAGQYAQDFTFELSDALQRQKDVLKKFAGTELGAKLLETQQKDDEIDREFMEEPLSQFDMNYKSGESYLLWDNLLNVIWQELKAKMDEEQFNELKKVQHEWIEKRDKKKESEGAKFEGGSMQPMIENGVMSSMTEERVYELYEIYGDL